MNVKVAAFTVSEKSSIQTYVFLVSSYQAGGTLLCDDCLVILVIIAMDF